MLSYPEPVFQQSAQLLGCVGLWSEWTQSAFELLDIESRQICARCASPLVLVIVHLFKWGELVGWLDDLRLKSMSPSPLRVCVCVRPSTESPFRDPGCNRYWLSLIGKDAILTYDFGQKWEKKLWRRWWRDTSLISHSYNFRNCLTKQLALEKGYNYMYINIITLNKI